MPRSLTSLAALLAVASPAWAQVEGEVGLYSDATIEGNVVEPEPVTVSDDAELAGLVTVPEGFEVTVAGRDLGGIRILATHGEHVYATRRKEGDVIRLIDAEADGTFEGHEVVVAQPDLHGLWVEGDTAYLATIKEVFSAPIAEDGSFGDLTPIIEGLPDGGQHPNRTLAIGPDGLLYVSVGSTCNACDETSEESATILRAQADGSGRTVFASGLRNTIGFGWHPETGALWGADHGIDWLGDEAQVEELNRIEEGGLYGWPYVYGLSEFNPQDNPPEGTLEDWAARSTEPALGYTAHAAPMQMAFLTSDAWPEAYRGDALIAMRGSWNRRPPSGYEVVRVDFEGGEPVAMEPFATGFLIEYATEAGGPTYGFLGRLVGLVQTPDGDVLVGDDAQGILWRISPVAG